MFSDDFEVGTILYVECAGKGALGCNNRTGVVVSNDTYYNNGIERKDNGFLIKFKDNSVWKVNSKDSGMETSYIILQEPINYIVELV